MKAYKYSESFEDIFNLTRKISEVCGADVLKKNYKICWKTVIVFILVNLAIGFTFYTNYIEVIVKGNHYNLLKSASILGTAIQGYFKLVNGLKQQDNFRFLHTEIKEMYETYELKALNYRKCLQTNISLVKKLLVTLFLIIILTSLAVVGVPIYMLLVLKKRVEILPFQLPFVDNEKDFGYLLTFGIHILVVFLGTFGNFVVDSWLFIFAAHIPLSKNILKCKFNDLDDILKENPRNVEKSAGTLNDIFKWHQKHMYFCDTIKNTFFWVIFVQIGTEFFGIVSTIVCIFLGIWPPAPAYLFYLFAIVYSYCSLGNLVEISNDDVTVMIYDSCWYNLTIAEQKMILLMLRVSQQAAGISIGGVAALSMNTALQLTKTIYTFSMILKEFLN